MAEKILFFIALIAIIFLVVGCQQKSADAGTDAKKQAALLKRLIASGEVPLYRCEVVRAYPHDPEAYTQGLLAYDGFFYESTGLEKRSTLRQVDRETGEILRSTIIPDHLFAEGLALQDGKFFQLTWKAGTALVYDCKTLAKIGEFQYTTEGWGLTSDGTNLIMSDGSSRIFFRDPNTFEPVKKIVVKQGKKSIAHLNELEFIEGEIFANIFLSDYIARIDPASGQVTGWIDAHHLRSSGEEGIGTRPGALNGIAFDQETKRIFLTGKRWSKLFEVQFEPVHGRENEKGATL